MVCLYVITLFPLFCVCLFLKKEKKKINLYIYNLELKQNTIITLDDYLLSCGGSDGGTVSCSGSGDDSSSGSGCDCCLL